VQTPVSARQSRRAPDDQRQIVFLREWAYNYGRADRPEDARRVFEELERAAAAGGIPGAGGYLKLNITNDPVLRQP